MKYGFTVKDDISFVCRLYPTFKLATWSASSCLNCSRPTYEDMLTIVSDGVLHFTNLSISNLNSQLR